MSQWRISPDEERWLSLAARFREQKKAPIFAGRVGAWRSVTLVTRCAFFILGLFVAGATLSICSLLDLGNGTLLAGLILIAVAEWLSLVRKLVFSGIEEALELAGLLMVAIRILQIVDTSSESILALVLAGVFAAVGLRLLNPLFTTLALICLSAAVEFTIDQPGVSPRHAPMWAGLFCFAVAWLALGLGAVRYRRPSHDKMLSWLMVILPPAGYLWMASGREFEAVDYIHSHSFAALLTPSLPLVFAATALITGIQRRAHAPLVACMLCIACIAFELRRLTGIPLEARLVLWGSIALAVSIVLDRMLRTPRNGITSARLDDSESALNLLELAGAAVISQRTESEAASSNVSAGEGRFGGGGASGKY